MYLLNRHCCPLRRYLPATLVSLACLFGSSSPLLAYDCPIDIGGVFGQYGGYYNGPVLPNPAAFAAIKTDGSIEAWGKDETGGLGEPSDNGYTSVVGNWFAFAALKGDGSISVWGDDEAGGGADAPNGTGFQFIASNVRSFAALHADGSLSSWGDLRFGGGDEPEGNNYISISANGRAFAALDSEGSIHAWGENVSGASDFPTDEGYVAIAGSYDAFAAMKADGSIASWGNPESLGAGAPTQSGFYRIYSTTNAFAALHTQGRIEAWGSSTSGGQGAPGSGVFTDIATSSHAFAALRDDGAIYAWGANTAGGTAAPTATGFTSIVGTQRAFAALHEDGTISSWGDLGAGGIDAPDDNGYTLIVSNHTNFAALKDDGTIYTWGGEPTLGTIGESDEVYVAIASTSSAFAALNADGSVLTWGDDVNGGIGGPTDSDTRSLFGRPSDSDARSCIPGRSIAPAISGIAEAEAFVGSEYLFTPTAFDPDGGALAFALSNKPTWLDVDPLTGVVSGTPNALDAGTASDIVLSVTDDQGNISELAPFTILVQNLSEQHLVTSLLGPEHFFVHNLTDYGIKRVVADYMGDYESAIENRAEPLATLSELQLIIDEVNELLGIELPSGTPAGVGGTPEPALTANGVFDREDTDVDNLERDVEILSTLAELDIEVSLVENLAAYRKALVNVDLTGLTSDELLGIISEVNDIEVLLNTAGSQDSPSFHTESFTQALESFDAIGSEFYGELAEALVELENHPSRYEDINALISNINDRAEFQPVVYLVLEQDGQAVHSISSDNGPVTLRARVENLDVTQSVEYDWSASTARILLASEDNITNDDVLRIDPIALRSQDRMIARLTASNRGLSSTAQLAIVVDNNNTHIATDSDNDGIADQFEGSLNASNEAGNANKIQGRVGEDSAFVLETEADLKLRIGTDSRVAGTQQAGLNFNELLSIQPSADVDPLQYENPEQVYDFEISGLSRVGDSVYIVLPHQRTFAEGSVYGKFHPATGWVEFVEDSFNSLSSAKAINDVSGQCPAPHSEAYEPGIQPGHSCLRLWIQDGGPNDADSLDDNGQVREDSGLNGSVADPGAILTPAVDTTPDSVEGTTANTVAGPNTVANPNTVTNPTSATDNTTSAGPFDLAGNVDTTGVVGATDSTVVDFVPQIGAASGTSLAANTVSGSDGGDSVDDTEVAVEEVSETSGAGAFGIWGILLLISVAIRTGLLRRIFHVRLHF